MSKTLSTWMEMLKGDTSTIRDVWESHPISTLSDPEKRDLLDALWDTYESCVLQFSEHAPECVAILETIQEVMACLGIDTAMVRMQIRIAIKKGRE